MSTMQYYKNVIFLQTSAAKMYLGQEESQTLVDPREWKEVQHLCADLKTLIHKYLTASRLYGLVTFIARKLTPFKHTLNN